MKLKYFFLIALSVPGLFTTAQNKKTVYKFYSINSVTLINGSNATSAALQSVNGFKKGPLFAGLGLGLDYYLYRTIPVFADVRYEFGKNRNKFFAYTDAGINASWVRENNYNGILIPEIYMVINQYQDGFYMDAGMGYKVKIKKQNSLVLAVGHSQKTLKQTSSYFDGMSNSRVIDIYHYKLNRIVLKAGWEF